MKTIIMRMTHSKPEIKSIEYAARCIKEGKLVVFPTETVYGIGANALDREACMEIFSVKGRKQDNPLIVHVSDMEMAKRVCSIPDEYEKGIRKVWPGPVTLILKSKVSKTVTGGLDTVAVRMPSDRIARMLIRKSAVPIAAPSANISEMPSSTRGAHAIKYFDGKVAAIIDAGPSRYGLESTVVDLKERRILRPGSYPAEKLEKIFGFKFRIDSSLGKDGVARSPGMKYRHYSPSTPLFMFCGELSRLPGMLGKYRRQCIFIGSDETCRRKAFRNVRRIGIGPGRQPRQIARNLFDALIRLDSLGAEFAVIEKFKEKESIGMAIMNRIRKASGGRSFSNMEELALLLAQGAEKK